MTNHSNQRPVEDAFKPCGHEPPQGNSQLHGVCIFCYRDRLGAFRTQLDESRKEIERLHQFYQDSNNETLALNAQVYENQLSQKSSALERCMEALRPFTNGKTFSFDMKYFVAAKKALDDIHPTGKKEGA